jgi:two-component system phosphate regulon response regulator OmpR
MYEKKHILVVDDDIRIRKLIQKYLRKNDYLVSTASNAHEAVKFANIIDFDLFIIDVMMPGEDGLSLTKKLLENYYTPIIILTARKETSDRIIGLETGADDYISKPFEPRELILRMKSIFKRIKKFEEQKSKEDIRIGILKFDIRRQELYKGNNIISLTRTERVLINHLIYQYQDKNWHRRFFVTSIKKKTI